MFQFTKAFYHWRFFHPHSNIDSSGKINRIDSKWRKKMNSIIVTAVTEKQAKHDENGRRCLT